jgi:hypothetical protein
MTDAADEPVPAWCEHGPGAHNGAVPAAATAPVASRAWLLIEHAGPWAHSAVETGLPAPHAALAARADRLGIRVQLIRRPARGLDALAGPAAPAAGRPSVFAAWTSGPEAWTRSLDVDLLLKKENDLDLVGMAEGVPPALGDDSGLGDDSALGDDSGPLFLVCAHARRDRCCGRLGTVLARELAARYPERVWETTHLGGHRHAANLALLPHGLYYGPCDLAAALGAIDAYQRGEVTAHRYRGRAGHDEAWQQAEQAGLLASGGSMRLAGQAR